ncbi:MAG: GTP 3',8-cyclase MoaA [Desulfobacterales bacterium]|nr:GTP 3',8-cyclase MoaA [Desulfobacterales bacterium]
MKEARLPGGASKLVDRFDRHLSYLRISITDRCNLRCIYCKPDMEPKLDHGDILRYEELLRLIRVAASLGVSKVRITGGEPLVRKGVNSFLARVGRVPGLSDISLTTNGVLLKANLDKILSAGIKRLNISLDTMDREKFKTITGRDAFDRVWEGIMLAEKRGVYPIKINVVALAGLNDDELEDFARLSFSHPFHIRFIEYMPMSRPRFTADKVLLTPEIKSRLRRLGAMTPVASGSTDGPAERYRFRGAAGEVGFISAMSHHFCGRCNRLRLTARGGLRPCLLLDHQEDLREPLRAGADDEELAAVFLKAIAHKPANHNLQSGRPDKVIGRMSAIGG